MANEIKEVIERTLQDVNSEYQNGCAALGHNSYLLSMAQKLKAQADADLAKLEAEVVKLHEKLDQLNAEARALTSKDMAKVEATMNTLASEVKKVL